MKGILKVLVLVIGVMVVSGCGGHYVLDKYIDQNQIVSSNDPNAINVYVGGCKFNDGPGGPQSLNKSTAEGEISLWIKKALVEEFGKVTFVDSKQQADIAIETKKVEFNVGGWGPKNRVTSVINCKEITVVAYGKTNNGLSPINNIQFSNMLMASSKLLAQTLKQSISIVNGKTTVSNLPKKIEATFRNNNDKEFDGNIYDIEVSKDE
ncbi:MAG: hypothetical protein QMD44_09410 [Thermodesulfovibrionales bacterium]|nr:hypothetical protein [Thermodesulfovibrionales bacterium]